MLLDKTFQEPSSKSSGVFRTQASIYDWAFLWIYLTTYYFRNKSFIIDVQLGYIDAFENIETFKVKLRWGKSYFQTSSEVQFSLLICVKTKFLLCDFNK